MSSTNEQFNQARRFLAVRLSLGLSQQAFADGLGISLRAEQNYERGARKLPADVLLNLSRVHQIDPLWVLDGPGDVPRVLADSGVNEEQLIRATKLVRTAVADTGKEVGEDQFAQWVAAVYRFYTENTSGTGAEALVRSMIRAK